MHVGISIRPIFLPRLTLRSLLHLRTCLWVYPACTLGGTLPCASTPATCLAKVCLRACYRAGIFAPVFEETVVCCRRLIFDFWPPAWPLSFAWLVSAEQTEHTSDQYIAAERIGYTGSFRWSHREFSVSRNIIDDHNGSFVFVISRLCNLYT